MSFTESILQAIQTIVQSCVDNAPYDKSCMGQIISIYPETYTCSVRINGTIYHKVMIYGDINTISVGNTVRVVIPNNQTSQMFILSYGPYMSAISLIAHPIGSIFMTCEYETIEQVHDAIGGTWVAWGEGKVPVGYQVNDVDFNIVEKTGGSKYIQDHHHDTPFGIKNTTSGAGNLVGIYDTTTATSGVKGVTVGASEGANIAGNLQPYIVCYMYKRIA